nr:MAG TPA: hypothetical protein [Caudoviricetes sp.]
MENNYYIAFSISDSIEHFGIKGMKWGKRIYSNHKENLLYKYRKKGLSESEAQSRLKRRLRNEKIALAGAGLAALGIAGYYGKNYLQDEVLGRTFRKGAKIDTVTSANELDKSRPFYGAFRNRDKQKYRGYYAMQRNQKRNNPFFSPELKKRVGLDKEDKVLQLVAKNDVRVAPNAAARHSFEKLYKNDSSFRKNANEVISAFNNNGKISNYDAFNRGLTARSYNSDIKNTIDKFYGDLRKKGYHALIDANDKKYSGYNTKNPTIFFDHNNLSKINTTKLTRDSIMKDVESIDNYNRRMALAKSLLPKAAALGGAGALIKGRHNTIVRTRDKEKRYK